MNLPLEQFSHARVCKRPCFFVFTNGGPVDEKRGLAVSVLGRFSGKPWTSHGGR